MITHEVAVTREAMASGDNAIADALRLITQAAAPVKPLITIRLCDCPAALDMVQNRRTGKFEQHAVHLTASYE